MSRMDVGGDVLQRFDTRRLHEILQKAKSQWLRTTEVYHVLEQSENTLDVEEDVLLTPTSGTILLYNQNVTPFYRKDGYNWKKKGDSNKVQSSHETLKLSETSYLYCLYYKLADNPNFHRRCYTARKGAETRNAKGRRIVKLGEALSPLVLVHYLDDGQQETQWNDNSRKQTIEAKQVPRCRQSSVANARNRRNNYHCRIMDVYHNKMDELSLNLRLQQALEQNNNVLDLPVSAHETSGGDDFKYEELDDDGDDDDEGGDGDDDDGAQGDDTVYDHVGRVSQKLAGTPPLPNSPSCELLPWLHDITPEHSDLLLDTTGDGIVQRTLPSCNRDAMQLCTENSRALFSVLELCPCWAPLEGGSKSVLVLSGAPPVEWKLLLRIGVHHIDLERLTDSVFRFVAPSRDDAIPDFMTDGSGNGNLITRCSIIHQGNEARELAPAVAFHYVPIRFPTLDDDAVTAQQMTEREFQMHLLQRLEMLEKSASAEHVGEGMTGTHCTGRSENSSVSQFEQRAERALTKVWSALMKRDIINEKDKYGKSLMHYACALGYSFIIELLLEMGASPIEEDNDGASPLELAISRHQLSAISTLLHKGNIPISMIEEAIQRKRSNPLSQDTLQLLREGLRGNISPSSVGVSDTAEALRRMNELHLGESSLEDAVIKLQCAFRSYRDFKKRVEMEGELLESAATKIQSCFRRYRIQGCNSDSDAVMREERVTAQDCSISSSAKRRRNNDNDSGVDPKDVFMM